MHCEELYPRLAKRGHEITVFVRGKSSSGRGIYQGVELRPTPATGARGLDQLLHNASGSLAALRDGFDLVHYHASGPALFSFLPRMRGQRIVATVHGFDWQRPTWGKGGRAILKAGEWAAAHFPGRTIVVSQQLQGYFLRKYGRDTDLIPNGVARALRPRSAKLVKDLGIRPGRYILFMDGLVPEKGCHDLITAYLEAGIPQQLVITGPSSDDDYAARVKKLSTASEQIIFTGDVEGELLRQLSAHAALFVLPSIIAGPPLKMLEMLALGVPVLGADIEPVREVLDEGKYGALFRAGDVTDLRDRLVKALAGLPELKKKAAAGRRRVRSENDWDRIVEQTELVFQEALIGA